VKPEELLFAKTHEWVHLTKVGSQQIATVGISAFAVEQLTDLVFLELPEVGAQVKTNESFGEIESVKAVSDVYSPVCGEVIEVNSGLADSLETFNADPYGDAWLIKVKVEADATLTELMDYEKYQKQCADDA
jgi:glycine cleavage system H protein